MIKVSSNEKLDELIEFKLNVTSNARENIHFNVNRFEKCASLSVDWSPLSLYTWDFCSVDNWPQHERSPIKVEKEFETSWNELFSCLEST
jgi:hypothetical protein